MDNPDNGFVGTILKGLSYFLLLLEKCYNTCHMIILLYHPNLPPTLHWQLGYFSPTLMTKVKPLLF